MPVLYIRVDDPEQHERIKQAARIRRESLNKFCLQAVLSTADVIVDEWEETNAKKETQPQAEGEAERSRTGLDGSGAGSARAEQSV